MTTITDYIIRAAQERIAAGRILSGGHLTSFLQAASDREGLVAERDLLDAALQKGLYSTLGRKYQAQIDEIIESAHKEIKSGGVIGNSIELRAFFEGAAPQVLGGYDPQKVETDLLIDARQKGLYELLPAAQIPKAIAFEWGEINEFAAQAA